MIIRVFANFGMLLFFFGVFFFMKDRMGNWKKTKAAKDLLCLSNETFPLLCLIESFMKAGVLYEGAFGSDCSSNIHQKHYKG